MLIFLNILTVLNQCILYAMFWCANKHFEKNKTDICPLRSKVKGLIKDIFYTKQFSYDNVQRPWNYFLFRNSAERDKMKYKEHIVCSFCLDWLFLIILIRVLKSNVRCLHLALLEVHVYSLHCFLLITFCTWREPWIPITFWVVRQLL